MKIGDKVSIGFNAVPEDELKRLQEQTLANSKGKKEYKQSPNEQSEPETGEIVGKVEDANGKAFLVAVDRDKGPPRVRRIAEDLLTAA